LPDRPFRTSVAADGRRFVVCSPQGHCRLFDDGLRQLDEIKLAAGVTWLQLNDTGTLLLVGFPNHIDGYATSPDLARFLRIPVAGTSGDSCVFKSDENVLCVASWDRKPLIAAWDLTSFKVIAERPLPPRGGAGYMLVRHPEGEAMAAVAFSGQSEEWMFWTHYAHGRLRVFDQPEIEDVALPHFHPTGGEFVSYHDRLGLCRATFPTGDVIATVQPEEAFPDNPEDGFSYGVHFSRDDRLLVWQQNLALYELDFMTLRPVRAVLTGAEGMIYGKDRFFSEESWRLAGGRLLTSDSWHDAKFRSRTDTLRLWDASALFGHLSAPDPACPHTKQLLATGD
jgi:hypothetical protein